MKTPALLLWKLPYEREIAGDNSGRSVIKAGERTGF